MKKNKKNKAAKKPTLLRGAAKSLKKLGKGTVGKLSTAQKVVAGAALATLGIRYLTKRLGKGKATAPAGNTFGDDAAVAENNLTTMEEEATA